MTCTRTESSLHVALEPFHVRLNAPLTKQPISVLQVNLGRRCNLACAHCHVEAGPKRTEELSQDVCAQLIEVIRRFDSIQTLDLTGGAPEMNYGFRPLVEAARARDKAVMVRSNLTIYFEAGFGDLPEYCARHQLHIVASLPCYLADNVNRMRGNGVFERSIRALQWLNHLGYGSDPQLKIDLVYNPQLPTSTQFSLTADQQGLERAYKAHLREQFGIIFNQLFTITNIPIGRTKFHLNRLKIHEPYLQFLAEHFNASTVDHLMCRNELSVDHEGWIYDCDFNQMEGLPARDRSGKPLTVTDLLEQNSLDIIDTVQTRPYCYGCTAGSGSSCGGSLV
ncbi:MAG: arsenosugar biosynthesis radical SAM (seleno)protein ArsS [Cyanobacteria bacterium J06642_2]